MHTDCLDVLMQHTIGSMPGLTLKTLRGLAVDTVTEDFRLCCFLIIRGSTIYSSSTHRATSALRLQFQGTCYTLLQLRPRAVGRRADAEHAVSPCLLPALRQ